MTKFDELTEAYINKVVLRETDGSNLAGSPGSSHNPSMKNNLTEDNIIFNLNEAYKKAINDLAALYVKNGEIKDFQEAKDQAQEYLAELIHNGDVFSFTY
jgi:hypothetical protein